MQPSGQQTQKPVFKKGLDDLLECKQGEELVAKVDVAGADKVKWLKNGEPLEVRNSKGTGKKLIPIFTLEKILTNWIKKF